MSTTVTTRAQKEDSSRSHHQRGNFPHQSSTATSSTNITQKAENMNPKQDWGYYAPIPRIIRTGYKAFTPMQKWLYVCLKDLCGDHGTCFRTLDALAEETGLSTGLLSESIPALHKAGLIHAEKKKRHEKGWPVWHITIVDIWGTNAKEHPTRKGSHNEPNGSPDEQNGENVHHVNESLHSVNGIEQNGSPGETNRQNASQNRDRRNNKERSNTTTEGITGEGVTPSSKTESPPQGTPPPENSPSSQTSFSELRSQWITAYGPYGDAKWDNDALRWIAEQGGSFDDIKLLYPVVADKRPEKVKNAWYKLSGLKNGQGVPVMQAAKRFSSYDDPNFRSDQNFYPVEGGSYAAV